MTKPPRRSIVANFGALASGGIADPSPALEIKGSPLEFTTGVVPPRVAAGVIGATQRTLSDIREERDQLKAQLAAGGSAEIDPALIDPSPFQDRLPDDDATEFHALKASMAEDGQKVPVEVRRHPDQTGRYQLVYGHRRWRAARDLGIRLKAIVVDVDDQGLAIAQGVENSARQDLTWIEKALFAWRMEEAGIRARAIRAALAVDDAELARFRQVCRVLGLELITRIGRAPKAGRPRWIELASRLAAAPAASGSLGETLAAAKDRPSDERFVLAISAFSETSNALSGLDAAPLAIDGRTFGKAEFAAGLIRLKIEKQEAKAFTDFFRRELPKLLERFHAEREAS